MSFKELQKLYTKVALLIYSSCYIWLNFTFFCQRGIADPNIGPTAVTTWEWRSMISNCTYWCFITYPFYPWIFRTKALYVYVYQCRFVFGICFCVSRFVDDTVESHSITNRIVRQMSRPIRMIDFCWNDWKKFQCAKKTTIHSSWLVLLFLSIYRLRVRQTIERPKNWLICGVCMVSSALNKRIYFDIITLQPLYSQLVHGKTAMM